MKRPRRKPSTPYGDSLPNGLLFSVLGEEARDLNISAVARAFGVHTCKVWHYFRGRNKWPADEWLKTLIILGAVHEGRERFEVYLPKTSALCRVYDHLKGAPHRRRRPRDEDDDESALPILPDDEEDLF